MTSLAGALVVSVVSAIASGQAARVGPPMTEPTPAAVVRTVKPSGVDRTARPPGMGQSTRAIMMPGKDMPLRPSKPSTPKPLR